jgi:hypothetical protein
MKKVKNVWQYAFLPAEERLDRIKNGDSDVYEKELARSMNVISEREALGIDTSEQKDWVEKLNNSYNAYNAGRMGIEPSKVNAKAAKVAYGKAKTVSTYGNLKAKAEALLDEYYEKAYSERKKITSAKEYLVNNGISENSADGRRYLALKEKEIENNIKKYKNEYLSAMKKIASEAR